MNNQDEKLDQLLRQWRHPVERKTSLETRVWREIAAREESRWSPGEVFAAWFGRPLAGPALAAALFLAAILGGVGAAELKVQNARQFTSLSEQEQAYFESINPVALARHGHHR